MPAKICLHFRVLRDLCGEKMGTEFMTIYLCAYIERQRELDELGNWTVAVMGRESRDRQLGEIDLGLK